MSVARRFVCCWIAIVVVAFLAPAFAHAKPGDAIGSHTAKVNGVEIHYLAAGAGAKTPVILLHGYAETSHMWLPLIPKIDDGRAGDRARPSRRRRLVETRHGLRQEDDGAGHPCAGRNRSASRKSSSSATTSA